MRSRRQFESYGPDDNLPTDRLEFQAIQEKVLLDLPVYHTSQLVKEKEKEYTRCISDLAGIIRKAQEKTARGLAPVTDGDLRVWLDLLYGIASQLAYTKFLRGVESKMLAPRKTTVNPLAVIHGQSQTPPEVVQKKKRAAAARRRKEMKRLNLID